MNGYHWWRLSDDSISGLCYIVRDLVYFFVVDKPAEKMKLEDCKEMLFTACLPPWQENK